MHDLFVSRHGERKDLKEKFKSQDSLRIKQAGSFKRFVKPKTVRNNVQWNTFKTICLNLRTFISHRYLCHCCSQSKVRESRLEVRGYNHVRQEISIVNILKQLRVLKAIAKEGKTDHEWRLLNHEHALMAYSELDSDAQANPHP